MITNPDSIRALGTILGVWAHPDDEAYLSAGLMTMATDAGSRVVCVTATRGEAGSPDVQRCPPEEIARTREAELAECLAILGVTEHHWLDYVDGTCADVDPDEAAEKVRALIDDVRPDTILTFGPEGFTDHPDHKAVSRWVVAAHARSTIGATCRVHVAAQTPRWVEAYGSRLEALDAFPAGFPPTTVERGLSIDAALPPLIVHRKVRALRAQQSQIERLVDAMGLPYFTQAFSTERFRLS